MIDWKDSDEYALIGPSHWTIFKRLNWGDRFNIIAMYSFFTAIIVGFGAVLLWPVLFLADMWPMLGYLWLLLPILAIVAVAISFVAIIIMFFAGGSRPVTEFWP